MANFQVLVAGAAAVVGALIGAGLYHVWRERAAHKKRRIPPRWFLSPRPVISHVEQEVWHWLRRAFFEYHVLVKIPVTRFMAPRTVVEGQQSHELLSGIHCTFTVCSADGTVIGCVDVPGRQGLKTSNQHMKQKLFGECGLAYAVVRAGALPKLEEMREAFLGEIDLTGDEPLSFGEPPLAPTVFGDVDADDMNTVPDTMRTSTGQVLDDIYAVDMIAVEKARASLRAKLERNRKIHFTNFDPESSGAVLDDAEHGFAVKWEDSFITPDDIDSQGNILR